MKKVVLALISLALASACAPNQLSQSAAPGAIHGAQSQPPAPQPSDQPTIPASDRAKSKEFYLDIRFYDDTTSQDGSARSLAIAHTPQTGYRATTGIDIGDLVPNGVEVSFPLPPEVETPNQASVVLILGCALGRAGDIYYLIAETKGMTFENVHGMPRGHFTSSDRISAAFNFCKNWPVTLAIKFLTSHSELLAYEQVYVYTAKTDPSIPRGSN